MNTSIFLKNVRIHRSFLVCLYKKLYKRISGLRYKTLSKRIRDAALSTFIHHYTFAAKSKSIKYDSRRTIRVGMETIPCTTQ